MTDIFRSTRHACVDEPYGGDMISIDPSGAREFLEAIIAAFSVLGGGMAGLSGFRAAEALNQGQPPAVVAYRINQGIGFGYETFSPLSILALIIMLWT